MAGRPLGSVSRDKPFREALRQLQFAAGRSRAIGAARAPPKTYFLGHIIEIAMRSSLRIFNSPSVIRYILRYILL
jgi:hypothetical protein